MKFIKKIKKDSVEERRNHPIYGHELKFSINQGAYGKNELNEVVNKFYSGDFGIASEDAKERNLKHIEAGKGNLIGVYKSKDHSDSQYDIIVYYSEPNDSLYVLSRSDFEQPEEAWIVGANKYFEEYKTIQQAKSSEFNKDKEEDPVYNPRYIEKEIFKDPDTEFGEPGHQLNLSQKEEIRRTYGREEYENLENAKRLKEFNASPEYERWYRLEHRLKHSDREGNMKPSTYAELQALRNKKKELEGRADEESDYRQIAYESGVVTKGDIENARRAVETGKDEFGKDTKLPADAKEQLEKIAADRGVDYLDVVEKLAEYNCIDNKNYAEGFRRLLLNKDKPYYFVKDAKEIRQIYYINKDTGELYESHKEAVEEYRKGHEIEVWCNGKYRTYWAHEEPKEGEEKPIINDSKAAVKDDKPDWLDDEAIDDIVYDKAWPVDINDVANELVKLGVKDSASAVKYINEYLTNNPSEKKHFKDGDIETAKANKEVDPEIKYICYQIKDKTGKELIGKDDIAFVAYSDQDLQNRKKAWLNGQKESNYEFIIGKFKVDAKDSCMKDEEFITKTKDGYEVITIYENEKGRKYVIAKKDGIPGKEFFVGAGYDTADGTWGQGYYDFKSEEEAADWLKKQYEKKWGEKLHVFYHK